MYEEIKDVKKLLIGIQKKLDILIELQLMQAKLGVAIEDPHAIFLAAQKRIAELNNK
jgi:hypothetical protein